MNTKFKRIKRKSSSNSLCGFNFTMEMQAQSNWCWAAVATSVERYYAQGSTLTQCSLVNQTLTRTNCCNAPSSASCNVPYHLHSALLCIKRLGMFLAGSGPNVYVEQWLKASRPVCARIQWNSGLGGHFVGLCGFNSKIFVVLDPMFAQKSFVHRSTFPSHYQSGGTWTHTYLTSP